MHTKHIAKLGLAAAVGFGVLAATVPARADWHDHDGWQGRDWHGGDWHDHDGHPPWHPGWRGPAVVVAPPPAYYTPPPVYYAPPPVYYAPPPPPPVYYGPPGISIGVRLP